MKKRKLFISATIASLLFSMIILSATASTTDAFTVSGLSTTSIKINLSNQTEINGTISANGNIRFFVTGPTGTPIYDLGIVGTYAKFAFTATEDGNYSLNFENGHLDPISVDLVFSTEGGTPNNTTSNVFSREIILTAITVTCLGALFVLTYFSWKKHRKNNTVKP